MALTIVAGCATWGLTRTHKISLISGIGLLLVPILDGGLAFALLTAFSVEGATRFVGAFSFGLLSMIFVQPLLVPQRLVVWRIARETVLRRKRQAALLMLGLIIASAIITSSLVVGDSLDATVQYEIEGAWGETDITVSGLDLSTGERVAISESIAHDVWTRLQSDDDLNNVMLGQQQGLIAGVSVEAKERSLPTITWLAFNSSIDGLEVWPKIGENNGVRYGDIGSVNGQDLPLHIVVNQVLADELELSQGETIELGWYVTEENQRKRSTSIATVLEVVSNSGQGAAAGTSAPAVFTDLSTAQRLQGMEGQLNTIYYAVDDVHDEAPAINAVVESIEQHLDSVMLAEDVGLSIATDEATGAITVSSERGLGRLSGDDVLALRSNLTELGMTSMMEVLQVPLIDVEHNDEPLLTLASNAIHTLDEGQRALWHASDSGFGFQIDGNGEAWVWRASEGETLHDFTLSFGGQYGIAAHTTGLVVGFEEEVDDEEWAVYDSSGIMHVVTHFNGDWWSVEETNSSIVLHQFSTDLSTHDSHQLELSIPSKIVDIELIIDDRIYLEIEGLLSVERYSTSLVSIDDSFEPHTLGDWPNETVSPEVMNLHDRCNDGASLHLSSPN